MFLLSGVFLLAVAALLAGVQAVVACYDSSSFCFARRKSSVPVGCPPMIGGAVAYSWSGNRRAAFISCIISAADWWTRLLVIRQRREKFSRNESETFICCRNLFLNIVHFPRNKLWLPKWQLCVTASRPVVFCSQNKFPKLFLFNDLNVISKLGFLLKLNIIIYISLWKSGFFFSFSSFLIQTRWSWREVHRNESTENQTLFIDCGKKKHCLVKPLCC